MLDKQKAIEILNNAAETIEPIALECRRGIGDFSAAVSFALADGRALYVQVDESLDVYAKVLDERGEFMAERPIESPHALSLFASSIA